MWRWKTAQVLRNRIFRATRNNRRWPSRRRRPPTARLATTTFISNRTVLCHRKVQLVASYISFKTCPIRVLTPRRKIERKELTRRIGSTYTYIGFFCPQKSSQTQQPQLNSLGSYRSSQQVNRPSPQSSPGLTIQVSAFSRRERGDRKKNSHREMKIIIFGRSFFSIAGEPVELQQ